MVYGHFSFKHSKDEQILVFGKERLHAAIRELCLRGSVFVSVCVCVKRAFVYVCWAVQRSEMD